MFFETTTPAAGICSLISRKAKPLQFNAKVYANEYGKPVLKEEREFSHLCYLQQAQRGDVREFESAGDEYKSGLIIWCLRPIPEFETDGASVFLNIDNRTYILSEQINREGKFFNYIGELYE